MPVNTRLSARRNLASCAPAALHQGTAMSSDAFIPNRERAAAANADIPVIDISPFFAGGKRTIVDEIARACGEGGFFGSVGPGLHEDAIAAIKRQGGA